MTMLEFAAHRLSIRNLGSKDFFCRVPTPAPGSPSNNRSAGAPPGSHPWQPDQCGSARRLHR